MKNSFSVLGVDGCRAGWISVETKNQLHWNIEMFSTIQDLWERYSKALLILIDIPIGLRDNGPLPRLCDESARKFLTRKRSSSIFPTPCRLTLSALNYIEANEINRSKTGKGLSKQTWNITDKIKEVDKLLRNNMKAQNIFIESHPEACFAALNESLMQYYKKTDEGIKERLSILKKYYKDIKSHVSKVIELYNNRGLEVDDILDAWILAVSASRGRSNLRFLPDEFEYDSIGLPMRIAIPRF
jgi:predicted RNase H-like nuclease